MAGIHDFDTVSPSEYAEGGTNGGNEFYRDSCARKIVTVVPLFYPWAC